MTRPETNAFTSRGFSLDAQKTPKDSEMCRLLTGVSVGAGAGYRAGHILPLHRRLLTKPCSPAPLGRILPYFAYSRAPEVV